MHSSGCWVASVRASWRASAYSPSTPSLPLALLLFHARSLDLIALGDEPAQHLGADVDRMRRLVYLCTALLTAASVATCGIIGFVGLVVPHAVRTMFRPLHRTLLPVVFVVGGCFLVLADVVSRVVVRPARASRRGRHRADRCPFVRAAAPEDAGVILEARSITVRYRGRVPLALDRRQLPGGKLGAGRGCRAQRQWEDDAGAGDAGPAPARAGIGARRRSSGELVVTSAAGTDCRV